jgi:hypothetical protein
LKFCQNTRTQFISAKINIPDSDNVITAQHKHVDRKIAYEILQKGTRGSFRKWPQQDIYLAITMLQMPHSMGGFGMTRNVIAQISAKVAMAARFLGFVGSLSSSEQQLRFPNQNVQDPVTWTLPHLIQLQHEYKKLVETLIVIFKNSSRSKTLQLPRLTYSSAAPHQPSFGYYAQYGATSAGRTA